MSTRTTYYNLTKPDADEHVLRTVINQNYDAIDLQMHANAEAAKEAAEISADEYDETASYVKGDFCINQNTLYRANKNTSGPFTAADWDATTIAEAFEPKHTWTLFETITADGNERFIYSSDLPKGITGIMISCAIEAGASSQVVGINFTFDDSTYPIYISIGGGINTTPRYSCIWYEKDGNMWKIKATEAGTAANSTVRDTENLAGFHIGDEVKKARLYAPANEVVPSGSTFKIYIRQ